MQETHIPPRRGHRGSSLCRSPPLQSVTGNICQRSGNICQRAGNIWHRSGNIWHRSENIWHRSENVPHCSGIIWHCSGNIWHRLGGIHSPPLLPVTGRVTIHQILNPDKTKTRKFQNLIELCISAAVSTNQLQARTRLIRPITGHDSFNQSQDIIRLIQTITDRNITCPISHRLATESRNQSQASIRLIRPIIGHIRPITGQRRSQRPNQRPAAESRNQSQASIRLV
jgi:hypothetical protein